MTQASAGRNHGTGRSSFLACLLLPLAACGRSPPPSGPPAAVDAMVAARSTDAIRRDGNHLLGSGSAYLEQHAHNPVDWYPWSPEALALARTSDRPIFLSIGYSSCHWCHVMEAEDFER